MAVKIEKPITGFAIRKPGDSPASVDLPDDNPVTKAIESRPLGAAVAMNSKVVMGTLDGRKTVYIGISFVPVEGVVDGKRVTVERPLEVFVQSAQKRDDNQWIATTMILWSQAAREGRLIKALKAAENVEWAKGSVQVDMPNGKKQFFDCEVAAIAGFILEMLHRRGFSGPAPMFRVRPVDELAELYETRLRPVHEIGMDGVLPPAKPVDDKPAASTNASGPVIATCTKRLEDGSTCGGNIVRMDGCNTCTSCADSKCQ